VVSMQLYQSYLDKSTPYKTYRWIGTGVVFLMFGLRIFFAQGWYIGKLTSRAISRQQPP
jgi:hypothetical protein